MHVFDDARPDPTRVELLRRAFEPSSLDEVAEAVSVASEVERQVYVARFGDRYRWSLAHRGGAYPLLRITARFLRVEHYELVIGFRTVDSGECVLGAAASDAEAAPEDERAADTSAVLAIDLPVSVDEARVRISTALG
jgi:hypothetical protein